MAAYLINPGVSPIVAPSAAQSSQSTLTASGSASTVFSNNTTVGNTVIFVIRTIASSDGSTNTYSSSICSSLTSIISDVANLAGDQISVWIGKVTGAAKTITVTNNNSDESYVWGMEITGGSGGLIGTRNASTSGSPTSSLYTVYAAGNCFSVGVCINESGAHTWSSGPSGYTIVNTGAFLDTAPTIICYDALTPSSPTNETQTQVWSGSINYQYVSLVCF